MLVIVATAAGDQQGANRLVVGTGGGGEAQRGESREEGETELRADHGSMLHGRRGRRLGGNECGTLPGWD